MPCNHAELNPPEMEQPGRKSNPKPRGSPNIPLTTPEKGRVSDAFTAQDHQDSDQTLGHTTRHSSNTNKCCDTHDSPYLAPVTLVPWELASGQALQDCTQDPAALLGLLLLSNTSNVGLKNE